MRHSILPSLILLTLVLSCGEKPNGGGKTPDEKKSAVWVDSFSVAGSMIVARAAAVLLRGI